MKGANFTNKDVDLMMEITETIVLKIIIINSNSNLVRPISDKTPVVSLTSNSEKV